MLAASPHLDAEATCHRVEPGAERRGLPHVFRAAHGGEQRILRDVLRVVAIAAHRHCEAKYRRRMSRE
jgi:hypothetical protein